MGEVIPLMNVARRGGKLSAKFAIFKLVGLLGIEPSLHPPHGRVLPVYYSPQFTNNIKISIRFSKIKGAAT